MTSTIWTAVITAGAGLLGALIGWFGSFVTSRTTLTRQLNAETSKLTAERIRDVAVRFIHQITLTYPSGSRLKEGADKLALSLRSQLVEISVADLRDQPLSALVSHIKSIEESTAEEALANIELGRVIPEAFDKLNPLLYEIRLVAPPRVVQSAGVLFDAAIKGRVFEILNTDSQEYAATLGTLILDFINSVRESTGHLPLSTL
ncbi:hypothetical protein [Mycobacteroides abscessus]|uniref:hypothetical protein n=1 Tax=Mycobacteroides abscessus TaxID=36809 RepID=UPI000DBB5777|nr:hypothetical protein [Mycobacteroides abscessus]BBB40167.1 hypothetical protein MASB_07330 [Mycobacteroides abscessus subsp. bolletii BD]